jgi:hypothetical protein
MKKYFVTETPQAKSFILQNNNIFIYPDTELNQTSFSQISCLGFDQEISSTEPSRKLSSFCQCSKDYNDYYPSL